MPRDTRSVHVDPFFSHFETISSIQRHALFDPFTINNRGIHFFDEGDVIGQNKDNGNKSKKRKNRQCLQKNTHEM